MIDTEETLRQMASQLNLTTAQAQEVTRALASMARSTNNMASAASAEAEALSRLSSKTDEISKSWSGFKSAANSVAGGVASLGYSVSGSTSAFTAIIPVLDLVGHALKSTIDIFSQVGGAATAWIPFLGSSLEKASTATGKAAMKAVDISLAVAKQQLQATQTLVSNYNKLTNVGMIFGGSLEKAQQQAANAGLSLETFGHFASKNAAQLAELAGNSQTSAVSIASMTKKLGPGLITIYGGFENLGSELADYMVAQTRVGDNAVKSQRDLEKGAREYLLNQKELSVMTGKSVDALKREQEERTKVAAYQTALNAMDLTQRQNTNTAITQISQQYGEQAGKLAMEMVAQGGNVISKGGLQFQAMMPEISNVVTQLLSTTNQDTTRSKEQQAKIIQDNTELIKVAAAQYKDLNQIFAAGYGPDLLKMINDTTVAVTRSYSAQSNMVDAQLQASKSTTEAAEKAQKSVVGIVDQAVMGLENFKIQMEGLTIKNLKFVNEALTLGYKSAEKFAESLDILGDIIRGDLAAIIKKLGIKEDNSTNGQSAPGFSVTGENDLSGPGPTPEEQKQYDNKKNAEKSLTAEQISTLIGIKERSVQNINPAFQDNREYIQKLQTEIDELRKQLNGLPARAQGGIANTPSIVGESGPEAVIPLKGGGIPMNIDFSPMLREMQSQNELTRELLEEMRDTRNIQQRILNAAY